MGHLSTLDAKFPSGPLLFDSHPSLLLEATLLCADLECDFTTPVELDAGGVLHKQPCRLVIADDEGPPP